MFEILVTLWRKALYISFGAFCKILAVVYERCKYVGVSNKLFTYKCQRIGDCMEFFIMACICLLLCPTMMKGYLTRKGMKFRFLLLRHTVKKEIHRCVTTMLRMMMMMCFISYVSSHGVKKIILLYTMMSKIFDVCSLML